MANYSSKELDRGKMQVPIYTPYIAPWPVPSAEHTDAVVKWKANIQAATAVNPPDAPFDDWPLYSLRFIVTADLLGAWRDFGGISTHLNFISIFLHVAPTESIADALLYDGLISPHLGDLGLPRANMTAGPVGFPIC